MDCLISPLHPMKLLSLTLNLQLTFHLSENLMNSKLCWQQTSSALALVHMYNPKAGGVLAYAF